MAAIRRWGQNPGQGHKPPSGAAGAASEIHPFRRWVVNVRAETPPGTRRAYRVQGAEEGFEFYGTRYTAKTVAARTAGGLVRNALSKGGLALSGAVALA